MWVRVPPGVPIYMDNDKLVNRAREIAVEAHAGQVRWDNSPYITHPLALDEMFATNTLKYQCWRFDTLLGGPDKLALQRALALLHDVFEDNPDNPRYALTEANLQILFNNELTPYQLKFLSSALPLLTRVKGKQDYAKYIKCITEDSNAAVVKLADLIHNLSTLKPGARKDKYQLAFVLLAGEYWPHEATTK